MTSEWRLVASIDWQSIRDVGKPGWCRRHFGCNDAERELGVDSRMVVLNHAKSKVQLREREISTCCI